MPRTLFLLAAGLVFAGCSTKLESGSPVTDAGDEDRHAPWAAGTLTQGLCTSFPSTCQASAPDYATVVVPILNAKCNGCHSGVDGGPWPLTNFEDVEHWQDVLVAELANCGMPPADAGPTLSDDERATLLSWLACVPFEP